MLANVQRFLRPGKQREELHFAREDRVDLLFLQETNFSCFHDVQPFEAAFSVSNHFSYPNSGCTGVGVVVLLRSLLHRAVALLIRMIVLLLSVFMLIP